MELRLYPTARPDLLGLLPAMLSEEDPRPAKEQFHDNYRHGGGWRPFGQDQWTFDVNGTLFYPGDPPFKPIARIKLRDEVIFIYRHALVCIKQPDGSFEVARMD